MNITIIDNEKNKTLYADADLSLPQVVVGFSQSNGKSPNLLYGDILIQTESDKFKGVLITSRDGRDAIDTFLLPRPEAQRVFVEPFKGRIVMEF